MAHFVGEHGAQLHFVQAGHQGQAEVEAAGAGQQAEQPGVLADGRVDLVDQQDLVGGAGADLGGDVADRLPQDGFLLFGDGDAGLRVVLGSAEHEHAAHDRDREDHRDDEDLDGDAAVQPGDGGPVGGREHGQQDEAEQVEACEQDESAQRAQ